MADPEESEESDEPDEPLRNETPAERMDRNWVELLQELRVTQTGVQILTGFLLILPFQTRFTELGRPERVIYLVAVALSVVSAGLLIAPVSTHRLLFRRHLKQVLVGNADLLAKLGLVTLALTMIAVVALVVSLLFGITAAIVAGLVTLAFFAGAWVILPLTLRSR